MRVSGVCVDCDESCSLTRNALRCKSCESRRRMVWTPERIVQAVHVWVAAYGSLPSFADWSDARRSSQFPTAQAVVRRFGSWNVGMSAAGFDPRPHGHQGGSKGQRFGRNRQTVTAGAGFKSQVFSGAED